MAVTLFPPLISVSLLYSLSLPSPLQLLLPLSFSPEALLTAVKPCIKALTYGVPPRPPLLLLTPPSLCDPPPPFLAPVARSATATKVSAADAVELITVSFICRLAAQRDLGIDQMPAD